MTFSSVISAISKRRWVQFTLTVVSSAIAIAGAIATIVSVILTLSPLVTIAIVVLSIASAGLFVHLRTRREREIEPHNLLSSYRRGPPKWLTSQDRIALNKLARGALLLLQFDRSPSGCWGKSYVYRRHSDKNGIVPAAEGSLTGTPLSLFAIGSATMISEQRFHEEFYTPLNLTLARILTRGGQYLSVVRAGTMGATVDVHEPPRHAAGGLTVALLQRDIAPDNIETLKTLCSSSMGNAAWDNSIVARALALAAQCADIPAGLRRKAKRRYAEILDELIVIAKNAPANRLIWSDRTTQAAEYNVQPNIQWGTVWMLLGVLSDPLTAKATHKLLRSYMRSLLLAQEALVESAGEGMPVQVSPNGHGQGLHVFGTAISALAWNLLATSSQSLPDEPGFAARAMKRLVHLCDDLLERPSIRNPEDPNELEGYFAWAGLLLAGASAGVVLSEDEASSILDTVSDMNQCPIDVSDPDRLGNDYQRIVRDRGLFDPHTLQIVVRSAGRISALFEEVKLPQRLPKEES